MIDHIYEGVREDYPYIGPRRWRFQQEVADTVGDYVSESIPGDPIDNEQIIKLLAHAPGFEDGTDFVGTTQYCHPFVQRGMNWLKDGPKTDAELTDALATKHRRTGHAVLANGWGQQQEFGRLGGSPIFWLTRPVRLGKPPEATRVNNQPPAELRVRLSAAGFGNRSVGLFAETEFSTNNQYVNLIDVTLMGTIDPDTNIATTPYHRLSDDPAHREQYSGCRPTNGTLFQANKLANFIVNQLAAIS